MRTLTKTLFLLAVASGFCANARTKYVTYPSPSAVTVEDRMWTPILSRTQSVTIPDVLDKFEGRHVDNVPQDGNNFWSPDRNRVQTDEEKARTHNTLRNFELVAEGHVADGGHFGFPWFDGLIYETITGISDFILQARTGAACASQCCGGGCREDSHGGGHCSMHKAGAKGLDIPALEARLDEYIRRIEAAQKADPTGYINTYTTLKENDHRWGENGGNLRWQHDVYNSGCLVEAGVHYYKATGKTTLLEVATRLANYMYDYMAGPRHNVVPGHALPEDALLQLYHLYKDEPGLKKRLNVPVRPDNYRRLAEFWIEQRGHTEGRRPLEAYAQDDVPVFEASTIEGHAVRATLFATGVASAALANDDPRYLAAAHRLWDNMVGRRMFITGGVGAIHEDEKFGPDYFLPSDAYLETCAAIGAGLFSWRMNQLTGEARYMDVLERIVFNSIPTAVSLKGDNYTYQNPLNADRMNRWPWHDCPCCPPMLLKMMGQLPSMIYSVRGSDVCVNLFIGSTATLDVPKVGKVKVSQQVDWSTGKVRIAVEPEKAGSKLRLLVRVPGWTQGEELPMRLYSSTMEPDADIAPTENGYRVYASIGKRQEVSLVLPVAPRIVRADSNVEQLRGLCSVASGPFVYCAERIDNESAWTALSLASRDYYLDSSSPVLGTPVVRSRDGQLTLIPFYMIANRCADTAYRVWAE